MDTFEGQVEELVYDEELGWWQASFRNEGGSRAMVTSDEGIKATLEEAMTTKRNVIVTYEEGSEAPEITSARLS